MTEFETLIARNKEFATEHTTKGAIGRSLPEALPSVSALIIGCADMRVDPAHVLGIRPGEAVVMRNIGGRVTPGLLAQLGMLGRIGQEAGKVPGGGGEFHLIVLQHTDCGITRLADDPALMTQYFGVHTTELPAKCIRNPQAAVIADVAALRSTPDLPGDWLVSGLVYDVQTGLVEPVVGPTPVAL